MGASFCCYLVTAARVSFLPLLWPIMIPGTLSSAVVCFLARGRGAFLNWVVASEQSKVTLLVADISRGHRLVEIRFRAKWRNRCICVLFATPRLKLHLSRLSFTTEETGCGL